MKSGSTQSVAGAVCAAREASIVAVWKKWAARAWFLFLMLTFVAGEAEAVCATSTIGSDTVIVCTSSDTITIPAGVSTVRYLVVAGGGGGGGINAGDQDGAGGGGAGGVLSGSGFAVTPGVYNVVVGTGGTAGTGATNGGNGGNSSFSTLTAIGGGGGAREGGQDGLDGGSGGGGSDNKVGGSGTAGQGNDGGDGDRADGGGGGGGAGGAGQKGGRNNGGDGGPGIADNITGVSLMYGGGGGGGADDGKAGGAGGAGGGASAPTGRGPGVAGTANTGGGGSGATGSKAGGGAAFSGGAGGSGIVVIRYTVIVGGCTTSIIGADTLVVCTSNDTLTIPAGVSTVRYLVVAGGGGGGGINAGDQDGAGGGGAGGVLSGSGFAVTPGVYNVVVGTGGTAGTGATNGGNGGNSSFSTLTAIGGGGGAREGGQDGLDGGSGGGGSDNKVGGSGTAGQGNDGGDGDNNDGGGGGGGAGGVGQDGGKNNGGDGGPGIADNITGVSLMYGGGGGGGADDDGPGGAGGTGGGASAPTGRGPGVAGTANTGGGGSGATGSKAGGGAAFSGGAGGSGVVIIRYTIGGLVAEYRLDELLWAAPGDMLDSSGNALHGQAFGGAVPVLARVCNGAQLNLPPAPLTDYMQVADDPLLDITTALTVTAWVNPAAYPGSGLMTVVSKDTNFEFHLTPTGQVFWWWNTGTAALTTGAAAVPLNTWTHIAITFQPGQQIIYVNGAPAVTGTDGATLFTNNLPLQIGDDQGFGGGSRRFRGLIDEVQVHNLALSAAEVVTVMNTTRPCISTVDHYFVQNAASGINCQAENITITAHDNGHVPTSAAARTITITANRVAGAAGTHGDYVVVTGTGALANGLVDDGIATYTFGAAETQVVLSYKNTWVQTVNLSVTDGTATDISGTASADAGYNQDLSFVSSGFRFVDAGNGLIADQVAGVSAGPFYLQAIQTGAGGCSGPGPCTGVCTVPSAFGNGSIVDVDLAFRCDNPITCQPGQQVSIANNGSTPIAANPAAGVTAWTTKSMLFGANGMAAFSMVYPDVGAISLHARYDIPLGSGGSSGNLMTGSSNSFVVSPYGFVIATAFPDEIKRTSDGFVNPAAATATDPMFIRAGDDFSATVTAVSFGGTATPNFGQEIAPETVQLTANLVGGLGLTNNPGLTNPSAFGAFSAGRATGTTFSWGEVGIITLTPSVGDGDYLGAGDVTGTTSGNVGRFLPFDFAVTRNAPLFGAGCSIPGKDAFTYIGESFIYQTAPVITVTARNKAGATTLNYGGNFFKIQPASLTGKSYTTAAGALDLSGIPGTDPAIRYNGDPIAVPPPPAAGTGTLTFSAGAGLFFTRTTPVAAFDAEISLAINVIDADGTMVALVDGIAGANPVRFGQATPGSGMLFAGTTVTFGKTPREMRFGRLRMDNVSGATRLGLPIRMQAQFYTTTGFVTNGDDSCTSLSGSDAAMAFVVGTNLAACDTAVSPSGGFTLSDGRISGLQLAAPGIGNDGSVDLTFNLGAAGGTTCTAVGGPTSPATATSLGFLQGNWGGSVAWDQNPSARATFGIYEDSAEFLYLQENY